MNRLVGNILDTDSYKFSQYAQYPKNMTGMYSYFESRGGEGDYTLFFGLQYLLKEYFTNPVTPDEVEAAYQFATKHGVPFNYKGWMYIANELDGKLPVRIKAVPEGTIVPKHNILMSIESTDEKVPWVVNWLETILVRVWYPISVATLSHKVKQNVMLYEKMSVDDDKIAADVPFKLNDFGSRGVSSRESAMIGGAAHLVNFAGTDTIVGAVMANEYYNHEMSGYSIPASEHSTVTSWGKDNEAEMMKNMLEVFEDYPLMACVSDSYDYYNSVDKLWGEELKPLIAGTDKIRICRPDSGDPVECVVYALESFDKTYGSTLNSKGYKVLNNMRVIQGDGIDADTITEILKAVIRAGFSVENVNFGMGGGLLQRFVNRDTHKFAFKCSQITLADGTTRAVYKDPVTDPGKMSKKGRLALVKNNGIFETVEDTYSKDNPVEVKDHLVTVFENGEITKEWTFQEVRDRAEVD